MTENTVKTSGRRERSPPFPAFPLEAALKRLVAFESHFKRSPGRPNNIGAAWGLDAKPYIHRISAALRYFGLLDYHGLGKDREIVISDEGRKYLRAQQEQVRQRLIQEAALRPKQISLFWDEWGDDRPSDDVCLDDLMFKHRFSEVGAKDFLKVYDETISFAGLHKSDRLSAEDESLGNASGDDLGHIIDPPDTQLSRQRHRIHHEGGGGMKEDVFALTEGDVVLQWPELLSRESFEDLKDWTVIVLRKIERKVAMNERLNTPMYGAMATQYSDDEEGHAAQMRDSKLEE